MVLTDAPARISTRSLSRVTIEVGSSKSVVESILRELARIIADGTLRARLVDNVDAVATTMASRNALRLAIESHVVQGTKVAELSHGARRAIEAGTRHRGGTLHASVCTTARSEARGLEREDLVGGQLLLVKGLLLLLQSLDLALNSNLHKR